VISATILKPRKTVICVKPCFGKAFSRATFKFRRPAPQNRRNAPNAAAARKSAPAAARAIDKRGHDGLDQ
jgi:hypothetical protein